MSYGRRAWSTSRPSRLPLAAIVVIVIGTLVGLLVERSPASGSADDSLVPGLSDRLPRDGQGGMTEADGVVPDGVTVFDAGYPAVAKLDPAPLSALRRAATDAASVGVELYVDSGWRSPKYQARLLREAITKYGSEEEAARWVASPDTSAHVSGDAVDIGPSDATAWLSKYGARYGLCQIYRNEPWHYELRARAVNHGCPDMYVDAAHDPRMQP